MSRISMAATTLLLAAIQIGGTQAGESVILNKDSFWRCFVNRIPPVVSIAAQKVAEKTGTKALHPKIWSKVKPPLRAFCTKCNLRIQQLLGRPI